jgi:hypothetical protein
VSLPHRDDARRTLTGNGPAIPAELAGEWWLRADAAALATIEQPAPLAIRSRLAARVPGGGRSAGSRAPNARTALGAGSYLIDPAAPEVVALIEEVLESR